ncbi:hypothetical protein [Mucilaginibacter psychrotolerans]|uniref:Uncharacterized protein n=1 Tax=Mucilaginibacter psychrotolerans TaxID=1524096 RepID=A0A4Y8SMF5_9SPHI|nr:hypothetical protein [Mucilaginibacter psychrotolerans]TFF39845.1 hypothetical protein E2R66_05640 [Mucilaginibacter psychrotolerans]
MNRHPQEIKTAIAKLERNLNTCVPYSCFGNDNKKSILVMLDVIKNNRSSVWINSTYLSISEMFHELPDNATWQSAMDAREWLDSQFQIEELLFKEVEISCSKLLQNFLINH